MKEHTYTSERKDFFQRRAWSEMISEVWQARELLFRLISRDVSVRYRQSYFGYVWAVLPQLATVAIFATLSSYRVFNMGATEMPYVIHAVWSISVWQLFSACLLGCSNSLVNSGTLITKVNFPKAVLVFSPVGHALLDFAIRLVPLICVMAWYNFLPSWQVVFVPVVLVFVIFLALGVGFILSIINLVLRDAGSFLNIVMAFGVFLAPILYPPPVEAPFNLVNSLNPFSPLLIATQDMLSGADSGYLGPMLIMMGIALIVFLLGWRLFCITMPRVAERA
tara:strand:- start:7090 stop:7926 length:837 start_codon:yes stop_codon:yes gene_type:complete